MAALLDALEFAGNVLDTPGAFLRTSLAGRNPFPGILDPSQRVSGRALLEQMGVLDPKPEGEGFGWGDLGGLGAEMALDPMNWAGGWLAKRLLRPSRTTMPLPATPPRHPKFDVRPEDLAGANLDATPQLAHVDDALDLDGALDLGEAGVFDPWHTEDLWDDGFSPDDVVAKPDLPRYSGDPLAGFYSRTLDAAKKLPPSVKGESLLNLLKKHGAPPEELEWMRAAELATPGQRLNQSELLAELERRQIGVKEYMRAWGRPKDAMTYYGYDPKYSSHQQPGGDNYRELTLQYQRPLPTLPANLSVVRNDIPDLPGWETLKPTMRESLWGAVGPDFGPGTDYYDNYLRALGSMVGEEQAGRVMGTLHLLRTRRQPMPGLAFDEGFAVRDSAGNVYARGASEQEALEKWKMSANRNFNQGHFPESDVLVHSRFNDRVGPAGEKVLHLEEVQSDLHQMGKEQGYRPLGGKSVTELRLERMRLSDLYDEAVESGADANRITEIQSRIDDVEGQLDAHRSSIPDTPFKNNWHELMMKRMLREAAEGGYDRMSWNPGEVNKRIVGGELPGQVGFYGSNLPAKELATDLFSAIQDIDPDELSALQKAVLAGQVSPEAYAQKLLDTATLPNWMNKYGKKWGVQVEPLTLQTGLEDEFRRFLATTPEGELIGSGRTANEATAAAIEWMELHGQRPYHVGLNQDELAMQAHSIPITPQMRQALLTRGQPLLNWLPPLAGGGALLAALSGDNQV